MPSYYTYVISSLPVLVFGVRPPLSFEGFLQKCTGLIPAHDLEILEKLSLADECIKSGGNPTLEKWQDFDRNLRNELVKIRAARKQIDPLRYLREADYVEPRIAQLAMSAYRNPAILDAEKMLDQARWKELEDLSLGHYFDMDFLIVYAVKLLILQRWNRSSEADATQTLQRAVT